MRALRTSGLLVAGVLLLAASQGHGETAVGDLRLSGEAEIGARAISGDDWGSALYENYRDQRPGLFGRGHFLLDDPDSGRYLRALLENVGERDERYEFQLGRFGGWRLRGHYSELPTVWSNQALSPFDPGTDEVLVLEDLRGVSLKNRLRDAGLGLRIRPSGPWELETDYRLLERRGTMPFSIGFGNPGDNFLNVARPVDESTHELTSAVRWTGDAGQLELGYLGSWFRNEYERLQIPNLPDSSTFGLAEEGQVSLSPDNAAHNFRLSGGTDLPLSFPARLSATFSYGWREQDEDFLCHSINPAFDGVAGDSCSRLEPSSFALPTDSLNGKVETMLGNVVLNLRPLPVLGLTARYRVYDYDNDTPEIRFPDHVENDTFAVHEARTSVAGSYRKHDASLEASWRIAKGLRLRTTYQFEQWERSGDRPVSQLDEHGGRFRLDWRPQARWQVRAGYEFGIRRGNGYDPFAYLDHTEDRDALGPEQQSALVFPEMRKHDVANRQRDRFDLQANFAATEQLMLGAFGRYEKLDYDDTDYGLTSDEHLALGLDLSWQLTDRVSVSSWYTFEDQKRKLSSRFRPRTFGDPPIIVDECTPPAQTFCNDWSSRMKEQTHDVGFRLDLVLLPDKLDASFGYDMQKADAKSRASNQGMPEGIGFISSASGLAWNYPGTGDLTHRWTFDLVYQVREDWKARLFYGFERSDLTNFRIDDLTPYGPVRPGETDLFLAERVDDYHAHIFGVSLIHRF